MVGGRLLEREAELAQLDALIAAARSGRGAAALIEGEPGVGKSALLLRACEDARASGLRVLVAHGSELGRVVAFGVARRLLGDRAETPASPPGERPADDGYGVIGRLFDALRALRAQESGGLLVAVDDAQWADEQSLRFLAHLALRMDELRIALVVACRTSAPDAPGALLAALREPFAAALLEPQPLSDRGVATLVDAVLGAGTEHALQDACARASGGNPFYLRELLHAIGAEPTLPAPEQVARLAPPRVLRSVMVRLGRLGDDALALARALVVLADGAPLRLAARLAELEPGAAATAADALASGRVLARGEPLRFAHPVIGSALAAELGHFDRARAHRRAADLLLADGAPVERIAAHLLRAPAADDARVVALLEDAGARALAAGAPDAAARLLARALEEPPDAEHRPRIMLAAAKAAAYAGAPSASDLLESALAALRPGEARAAGLAELATVLHHRGDFERAMQLAHQGQAELAPDHPDREQLLAIEIGAGLLHEGARLAMPAVLAPLVAAAQTDRRPRNVSLLAVLCGWMGVDAPPGVVGELARAATAHDSLVDGSHGGSVGWVASALIWADRLEQAAAWLDRAVDDAARRGAAIAGAIAALNRATVHYHAGRLDDAIADGERALDVYRYGWTASPWSTPVLAATHLARGDLPAARAALAIGERADPRVFDYDLLLEARCRLRLATGDLDAALADALAVGERTISRAEVEQPRIWAWRRLAATAANGLGRRDEALRLIGRDLEILREIGPARQLGESLTVAGLVQGGAAGLDLLAEAVATLDASPARLQRTVSLLELGGALRRAGRRTTASAPLYEALALAAEIGSPGLEAKAREELRSLGLRPRRTAHRGVASLTGSERRVASLAADGLSTPQIAALLHVTRSTVETHLGHVYGKLGIAGRAELPAELTGSARPG